MKKTNWKDIAELIGILAIVVSLVSVAFQLRQTQLALVAATYQARAFDAIAEGQYVADTYCQFSSKQTTARISMRWLT